VKRLSTVCTSGKPLKNVLLVKNILQVTVLRLLLWKIIETGQTVSTGFVTVYWKISGQETVENGSACLNYFASRSTLNDAEMNTWKSESEKEELSLNRNE
jgi:hypothetical protein